MCETEAKRVKRKQNVWKNSKTSEAKAKRVKRKQHL
jgi:hypothetical protein